MRLSAMVYLVHEKVRKQQPDGFAGRVPRTPCDGNDAAEVRRAQTIAEIDECRIKRRLGLR